MIKVILKRKWKQRINRIEMTHFLGLTYLCHKFKFSRFGLAKILTTGYKERLFACDPIRWVTEFHLVDDALRDLSPKRVLIDIFKYRVVRCIR